MDFLLNLMMIINVMIGGFDFVNGLNTTEVYKRCNGNSYAYSDKYADNVGDVVFNLPGITSHNGYNGYYKSPNNDNDVAHCYGRAACEGHLSWRDCESCLEAMVMYLTSECRFRVGVEFWLQDCRMRYENYDFSDF